jgi:hypothetical protein
MLLLLMLHAHLMISQNTNSTCAHRGENIAWFLLSLGLIDDYERVRRLHNKYAAAIGKQELPASGGRGPAVEACPHYLCREGEPNCCCY